MCNCTTDKDIRGRCNPNRLEAFRKCPIRVDTAVWLLDNMEPEIYDLAQQRKFPILQRWFDKEVDIRETEQLYAKCVLEDCDLTNNETRAWEQFRIERVLRIVRLNNTM